MNSTKSLPVSSSRRDLSAFIGGSEPAPQQHRSDESPMAIFHKIHRLLRGRYLLATFLAAIGAAAGAYGGYKATQPKFMSTGMIQIKPVINNVVYEIKGLNDNISMFSAFVKTQANLLQEPAVIDMAMSSKEWKSLNRPADPATRDKFLKSLIVATEQNDPEWIRVRFIDGEPRAAQIAVQQLIESYVARWGASVGINTQEQVERLSQNKKLAQSEIDDLRRKIDGESAKIGVTDFVVRLTEISRQLAAIEITIDDLKQQIKQSEDAATSSKAQEKAPDDEAINQAFGKVNEDMRMLLAQRLQLRTRVAELQATLSPIHRTRVQAETALKAVEQNIASTRDALIKSRGLPNMGDGLTLAVLNADQLAAAKLRLKDAQDYQRTLLERSTRIAAVKSDVESFQGELRRRTEEFALIDGKLRALIIESSNDNSGNAGRIQVVSKGEMPTGPYSDQRKKLAATGFLFGGAFPIGLIMLIGLMDRRFRYSDDAVNAGGTGNISLLGILPYLPTNMHDPEQAAVAAHCVHQIRTLLQIGGADHTRKVFAVTSPTSGDGKTSLSVSLGLSFATSGAKTLMIDFDLIGCGLTSQMQARTSRGLMDAITEGELNGHIRATSFSRLSILPAGTDDAKEVSHLSPVLVRRILDLAREQYDTVIIDTGPILGSLEASLVTAEADGVILAVGRGQQRQQVERAVAHLASVGAKLIGVVFNRAQPGDFRRAVSSASVRSVPVSSNGEAPSQSRVKALGPMAAIVASQMRPSGDDPE